MRVETSTPVKLAEQRVNRLRGLRRLEASDIGGDGLLETGCLFFLRSRLADLLASGDQRGRFLLRVDRVGKGKAGGRETERVRTLLAPRRQGLVDLVALVGRQSFAGGTNRLGRFAASPA